MTEIRYRDGSPRQHTETPGTRTWSRRSGRGISFWLTMLLAVVVLLIGLALTAGGTWLIALGGSWYYLVAGLGLILSGALMLRRRLTGVWVYLLVWLFTWGWALWEVGLEGWPLVPRVVAPTVLLVAVFLTIPVLRHHDHRHGWGGTWRTVAAGLVLATLGLAGAGQALLRPGTAVAKNEPTVVGEPPAADQPVTTENSAPEQGAVAPSPETEAVAEPGPAVDAIDTEIAPETIEAQATGGETGSTDDRPPEVTPSDVEPEPGRTEPRPVPDEASADWPAYGGGNHATRFSPLDQITPSNVGQLERVWEYRTQDMNDREDGETADYAPETTPLKVGDSLFLCSAKNILIALDAGTGREIWRFDPVVLDDAIPYSATCRGVAYYTVPDADRLDPCATRILEGTLDGRLTAVDARTGQPCADFGVNGQVDLRVGLGHTVPGWYTVTSPPTIVRGIAVVGAQVSDNQAEDAPSGVVRGYDAVTGELRWAWDLGDSGLTGLPPEGETYTRGTPNMWTIAAGDEELGHVYLPLGNSSVDYYGANRSEAENEYATALVAVDVTTGRDVWHFQTVHYDVWDYDLGSQPSLIDFPAEGGTVPAIILSSKQGDIFILDRRTGESLFPVEERPVPQGGVEPENLSPTQPFSAYHSLLFLNLEERDMWGMSPLDQLWCRIQFRQAYYEGPYTPPTSDRHWIQYSGYNGGQDWGSMAVDAASGILIANYNNMPNHNRLVPREEAPTSLVPINMPAGSEEAPSDMSPQAGAPYAINVNAGWRVQWTGLLCSEPPYGGIRAIDLATGETLWDEPLGTARKNGPWGIPSFLPISIGTPNNGGPVVTAGNLIFIAAATDDLIRAIDIRTGEVLWEDTLPAGGQATPITYESGGRQYLVLMAGGHHFMETPIGDHVIAWALPQQED